MLTVARLPKILRSTTASITMGITISPFGVSSTAGSVRKDVTSVQGEIGLSAHASNPTKTRVNVASFCRCDCCTRAAIELLSLESISIVKESHKFASKAIGAASSSLGDKEIGRARFRAADSSSEEFLDEVSPCFSTSDGITVQTSSAATLGEINRGRTSDESLRGSWPLSPLRVRALDMREAKLPTMRSAFCAAELFIFKSLPCCGFSCEFLFTVSSMYATMVFLRFYVLFFPH